MLTYMAGKYTDSIPYCHWLIQLFYVRYSPTIDAVLMRQPFKGYKTDGTICIHLLKTNYKILTE